MLEGKTAYPREDAWFKKIAMLEALLMQKGDGASKPGHHH